MKDEHMAEVNKVHLISKGTCLLLFDKNNLFKTKAIADYLFYLIRLPNSGRYFCQRKTIALFLIMYYFIVFYIKYF